MPSKTAALRALLRAGTFLHMPSAYDPLGARLLAQAGFEAGYCGGYVTGASRCITEPLLTMTEQIAVAAEAASAVPIPFVADAGAGFGDPLHTMRTVREFIRAGIAGIHIEDQLFPKRAHYHKYQVHAAPVEEFALKIRYACRERDRTDPDFVVIARTDTCREHGLEEAVPRLNRAAEECADMGLLFPRDREETERAPRECRLPLVCVMSRGNRDGRPIFTIPEQGDGLGRLHRRAGGAADGLRGEPPRAGGASPHRRLHRHDGGRESAGAQGDRGSDRPRRILRGRGGDGGGSAR
jgi:2-methylisocitrate lyase-like PEP mutase family enzyme